MISSQDGYGTRALSFGVFLFYSYAICLGYVKLERDRTQLINNTKKKKKRPPEWRSLLKLISAVPGAGLQPARGCPPKISMSACSPVSPFRHVKTTTVKFELGGFD